MPARKRLPERALEKVPLRTLRPAPLLDFLDSLETRRCAQRKVADMQQCSKSSDAGTSPNDRDFKVIDF